jgi:peptidoglycan/xylan/chitin deacetylase (PgdA/CDA1 family)
MIASTDNPAPVAAAPAAAAAPAVAAATPSSFVALMYHNVGPDGETYPDLSPSATSYFVSRSRFEQQLKRIASAGASFMTLDALAPFYADGRPDTARPPSGRHILLTFDDGWADGVHVGGPVLQAAGAQALLFVTTDFLGKPHFLTRADLPRLDPKTFRVGSHARSHRMLILLAEDEIRAELSDSKKLLEDALGYAVDTISIPSGAVDHRIRRIAAECGYRFVFDSEVRVNRRGDSPLAIARVAVMHDTPLDAVDRYVNQQLTRERVRRAVLQAPKRLLGLKRYERLRRTLLGEKRDQRVTHQS